MASCQVFRDDNGNITRVEAPNGRTSLLYQSINQVIPDKEQSLLRWAEAYTPSFKEQYGDWEQLARIKRDDPGMDKITLNNLSSSISIPLDENGEPDSSIVLGNENKINYNFRAIKIIYDNLSKVNRWFNQIGNNDQLWKKIQTDLQIPKEQLDLLRSSEGQSIEEKLVSFAAGYSYTIEINTAKQQGYGIINEEGDYENDGSNIEQPTQYYSNLTVPGGTNYTENEIATPAITPSIKGHAQFSTDNGIGWFRSDEQITKQGISNKLEDEGFKNNTRYDHKDKIEFSNGKWRIINSEIGEIDAFDTKEEAYSFMGLPVPQSEYNTKTRRILEVQSDLFQKGRDLDDLVTKQTKNSLDNFSTLMSNLNRKLDNDEISLEDYRKERQILEDNQKLGEKFKNLPDNQFLQLLNKDNNWVTFFVKSIIQDSAKKGYEKVLFPTGNTASKVEGHSTLEDFKKQKEDRIRELEKINKPFAATDISADKVHYFNTLEEAKKFISDRKLTEYYNAVDSKELPHRRYNLDKAEKEITQLKQELEQVDKEGFGALKPIYNFYENTVTNILKKQGYNPVEITDEYGNKWNEVALSSEQANQKIFLQQSVQSPLPSNQEINSMVEGFLEKIGVSVHTVRNIRDADGNAISAVAKADMLNKIIEVVEDKADITTLPEEAAHFFVEMLGDDHPLLKQMVDKINNYKIYGETFEQYKSNPAYRNADGTINFFKIKKEAVGKLIAFHIIGRENGSETEAKLTAAMNWWQKVLNFIKSLFGKVDTNPFREAAARIVAQDTTDLNDQNLSDSQFFQLDDSLQALEDDQNRIQLDNSIDPVTKQKRHVYTYDGVEAKGSVTSVYVDNWLKKIFRSDNRSERQKLTDLLKAEYGDKIHEEMQNILSSWTNPDGTLREAQAPHQIVTSKAIYDKLNNYVQQLLAQYPEGTIFKAETKIFDKKTRIAGSVDFMAIMPDGTVDIMDWKSQEIGKNQKDIKTYKEPMYRIQLENYRKILELQYGFKKFGKIRAIPIKTSFIYDKGSISTIKEIEIGDINPMLIPEDKNYLLPVTLRNEATGSEQLDKLLERLNGIYDKISNSRYSKEELYKKREELAKLRDALRDLQLRNKVDKLVELGLLEFHKYSEKIKNGTLSGRDIMEAQKTLQVFNESGTFLYEMMQDLQRAAKDTGDPAAVAEYNDIKDKFLSMTARTGKLISDIGVYRDKIAEQFAAENGIENLLNPEKPVGVLNGLFSALSNITQKSFRTFSKILRKAQNVRDAKFDEMAQDLSKLKSNFESWAKRKGLTTTKAMEMILGTDKNGNWNGNFLSVYQPEFRKLKEKAIRDGDTKWLTDNLLFDQERYKKQEEKQIEFFNSIQYHLDEKKNKETVEAKIKEWKLQHQVLNDKGFLNPIALMNPSNHFLKPAEKWYSQKWIELNKEENKPLKEVYDYFQSMIRYAEKLGMLDKFSPGFIPSIFATKVDQLVFGDMKNAFSGSGFFENLQVDSGSTYTPEVDPTDGSVIHRIPVYFTRDIGVGQEDGTSDYSKKSQDLFKVFAIWGAHMYGYEAMSSIEDTAMVLLEAEKNKESLVTDRWNNVIIENGKVKTAKNNDKNAKLLEDFINYYLYDQIGGAGSDIKFKAAGKEYSLMKTVQAAMQFFSFKTLALNPISGTAQFVGGTGNALFMAQKGIFFTKSTWAKAMKLAVSDKKAKAAIEYFNTRLEGNQSLNIDSLSLSGANRILTHDNAYIIQRKSDAGVQHPVAVAMMLNHMIDENNNIVDIQQYVKNKYNYNNTFYSLNETERKELRKKIDQEVKELQDTKSLLVVGELDQDGKFSLPGLNKKSDTVGDFRSKVKGVTKKIIGNSTRDDINHIRTTLLGMSLMQFRSWMPEMVEERLAGLKYDDELGTYTYGKMNLFFGEVFSKRFPVLLKSIVTGFGNDAIQGAKDKYEELKRAAFERGETFDITEGEFIDLYLGNIRSQMLELLTLIGFVMSIMALGLVGGDDDEEKKGIQKYANRALQKYYNEFAFYYNPIEFTRLVKAPLPVIGLAEDFFRFTGAMSKQLAGVAFNEEWQEEAKPSKYFFRMVPIAKEAMLLMAAHDEEFRKEWGIRIQ